VLIGFGSMTAESPQQATRLVIQAVQEAGVRAVVASGWAGLGEAKLPDSIHLVGDVPHSWPWRSRDDRGRPACRRPLDYRAVPRGSAVLGAPRPWAWLGPDPLPRNRLTPYALAVAIRATAQPSMRDMASRVGIEIRSEDGVGNAVLTIERVGRW